MEEEKTQVIPRLELFVQQQVKLKERAIGITRIGFASTR